MAKATISFPTAGRTEPEFRDLHIVQEEYRHDVAVYTVKTLRPLALYRPGTPVVISWGVGATARFYGYIRHIEPSGSSNDGSMMVWCRGASSSFDNGLRLTRQYVTVPQVVGDLARSFNFDVDIAGHPRVYSSITSTGERAWDFLVRQAQAIGYSLHCTNTQMILQPRWAYARRFASQAPVLTLHENLTHFVPIDGVSEPGAVRAAHIVMTQTNYGQPVEVRGTVAAPVLARSAQPATVYKYDDRDTVHAADTARYRLQALAEQDRYYISATATADGDARVTQTWPVLVANVSSRYVGLWFVRKVTHIITDSATLGHYRMELELGRDGVYSTVAVPDSKARRILLTRNTPQGKPKVVSPPSQLINNAWKAQWSSAVRVFA